jgi:4-hydroxy-3-methylbut-2-en-1-yl diphosphate reductase
MPQPPIRILLANPRGFCAGVEMAVECLDLAIEQFGPPVFVYHYIVHNKVVVEGFERRGAVFVHDLDRVPAGCTVLFSAHGVSPEIKARSRAMNLRVVDTTCPLVTKVHREVREFVQLGYTTLLIGHRGHDEVVGILGEAEEIVLIENPEQAEAIQVTDEGRVAYTTQTTLSLDECAAIIDVLRRRFPRIRGPAVDDICYATQNRQRAVRALARMSDAALVIGSANSSNTARLVEIAESAGIPAYRIDAAEEIDAGWFSGTRTLLLTAGASVPEALVQEAITALRVQVGATLEEQPGKKEVVHFALPVGIERGHKRQPLTFSH